jgi:hypothetical protein
MNMLMSVESMALVRQPTYQHIRAVVGHLALHRLHRQLDVFQRNVSKTEVMYCAFARQLSQLQTNPLPVADTSVPPVSVVRDLEIFTDFNHWTSIRDRRTAPCCFAALRQLTHLCRYVSDDCFRSLVMSLIHSRID